MPNAGVAAVVPGDPRRRPLPLPAWQAGLGFIYGSGDGYVPARGPAGVRARPAGQLAMLGSAGGFAHEGLTATQEQELLAQQALGYRKLVTLTGQQSRSNSGPQVSSRPALFHPGETAEQRRV
ncbi:TPA: hypothetical protein ACH3X1_014637 [Trebouxia sp. C0004]